MSTPWVKYEDRKDELLGRAKHLRDNPSGDSGGLSTAEETEYDAITAQVGELSTVIEDLKTVEMDRLNELITEQGTTTVVSPNDPRARDFFRNMEKGVEYTAAMSTDGADMKMAWSTGSGSGANLVGEEWHEKVEEVRFESNFLRKTGAKVIKTESTHNIPLLSALATAAITGENAAYTASDPTISNVSLSAYKLTLKTAVSEELLADAFYDTPGELAIATGYAFGAGEESYGMTGTGSSQPTGIFNESADKTVAAADAITKDELVETTYGLARRYRDGAIWMMDDTTVLYIAKLKLDVTTSGTLPYYWTDAVGGEPPKLLSYPVYTHSSIADIGASNKVMCFGNPKYYVIGERGPMVSKRLTLDEYSDTFAFNHRIDGKPLTTDAFYVVAMHA